jgi:hypothetical protein
MYPCINHVLLIYLNSPQAIFKDPFRRGNNILVSYFYLDKLHICVFTWLLAKSSCLLICIIFSTWLLAKSSCLLNTFFFFWKEMQSLL